MTSFGPPSQKQLVLLYDDGHYNVITSLLGFFGTSYFCARCLKPYDNQGHHACDNNPDHCSACLQTECPDYTEAPCRSLPATQTCDSCRQTFYATACFTNHVSKTQSGKTADHQQLIICTSCRKCSNCRKLLVGRKQQQEHRCGYQVAASLATVHSNEDDVPSTSLLPSPPADGVDLNDEKPPLHVFFDMEAMQDTGRHVPNLLVAKTENDEGDSCMHDFLEWLDTLMEEDSQKVKIKEEASGWPSHVGDDPLKRQQDLDDYRDKEGIELDPEKIEEKSRTAYACQDDVKLHVG